MIAVLPALDPARYQRHALHAEDRVWVEKNCYVDVWIEAVHALGRDPGAMLGFVLRIDFEGDQWTFFKPSHDDMRAFYGVDVQELNVWRALIDHAREHLPAGRLISTEADAFWLPDTAGTDYRRQHTKTTIIIERIDPDARRMGYFHNAGYHQLDGEDFERLFRLDDPPDPAFMPLYAEFARTDRLRDAMPVSLRAEARERLAGHLAGRAQRNPVERFVARLQRELPDLQARGLEHYHAWAFATIRQLGAASELAAYHLRWIDAPGFEPAAARFDGLSQGAKTLILKAARAVNARRALNADELLEQMVADWDAGMVALESAVA